MPIPHYDYATKATLAERLSEARLYKAALLSEIANPDVSSDAKSRSSGGLANALEVVNADIQDLERRTGEQGGTRISRLRQGRR